MTAPNLSSITDAFLSWMKGSREGRADEDVLEPLLGRQGVFQYLMWLSWPGQSTECVELANTYRMAMDHLRRRAPRTMFMTNHGRFGNCYTGLQEGDLVSVIPGCNMPILLRPTSSSSLVVGECYVNSLMYGEAMCDLEEGKLGMTEISLV